MTKEYEEACEDIDLMSREILDILRNTSDLPMLLTVVQIVNTAVMAGIVNSENRIGIWKAMYENVSKEFPNMDSSLQ